MIEVKEKGVESVVVPKFQSKAKTKQGVIEGLLIKLRNDVRRGIVYTPKELEILLTEYLSKFKEKPKKEYFTLIDVEKWRGKGSYELYRGFDNDLRIVEYRKNKYNGQIDKSEPIVIKKEYINYLLNVISKLELGLHYPAKYFWKKIIVHYDLKGVDLLNFNGGGKQRSTYYFPLYLYPMRAIEQLKLVNFSCGKGGGIWKIR